MANDPYDDRSDANGERRVGDDVDDERLGGEERLGDPDGGIDDSGTLVEDDYPEDETYDYRDGEVMTAEARDDDSWWDEGLIALLLVAGLALFLFPEPVTSGLGVALLAVGAAFWVLDWLA